MRTWTSRNDAMLKNPPLTHVLRGWRIILVDQRNHGHSAELEGFDPPHTLQAAAQDLHELIQQKYDSQQLSVMVGHSLGGKTTLAYLEQMAAMPTKSHLPQQVCNKQIHGQTQLPCTWQE